MQNYVLLGTYIEILILTQKADFPGKISVYYLQCISLPLKKLLKINKNVNVLLKCLVQNV